MTHKALRELVRVAYVKVAEYQRRGLVHVHVVVRVDRAMPTYRAEEASRHRTASALTCSKRRCASL